MDLSVRFDALTGRNKNLCFVPAEQVGGFIKQEGDDFYLDPAYEGQVMRRCWRGVRYANNNASTRNEIGPVSDSTRVIPLQNRGGTYYVVSLQKRGNKDQGPRTKRRRRVF